MWESETWKALGFALTEPHHFMGAPEHLHQARAVVTSGALAKVRKALAVTGLDVYFDNHVYSAYEVGIWKPDPGIYLHAAADMGFRPARCLALPMNPGSWLV